MRYLFGCFLMASSLWGQMVPVPPVLRPSYGAIRTYLGLTEEQVAKMQAQMNDYSRWASLRQRRMSEVQLEIAVETAKSPLDPAALGVRYAEVEAIRREIAERGAALLPANVALLTEAQKVKLKALEEALKLAPTGDEAKALRLLPDDCATGRLGLGGGFLFDPAGSGSYSFIPVAGGGTAGCASFFIGNPLGNLP